MCAFDGHRKGFDKKLKKSEGVIAYKELHQRRGNQFVSIYKHTVWHDRKMTVGEYDGRKMKEHSDGCGPGIYAWKEDPGFVPSYSSRVVVKVLLYGRVIRYYAMDGGMYPGGYMAEKAEIIEVVR